MQKESNEPILHKKEEVYSLESKVQSTKRILEHFSSDEIPISEVQLTNRIRNSLIQNSCVEFIQLSCPRIDSSKIISSTPQDYILTSPDGNNFDTTAARLGKVIKALSTQIVPSLVNIVLVDTDEDDYVFPVLGTPPLFDYELAEERKSQYFLNFTNNLKNKYYNWLTFNAFRWSQIRDSYQPDKLGVSDEDLQQETSRMREIFSPGNYYGGLSLPSERQLQNIVELKFMAYANQGYQLGRFFPNAILIQNEFPLALRTKMLNLSNDEESQIPAIYPYGRSESPY